MSGESVRALLCTLIPIVACIAAGSAVGRGRSRGPGADMLVGFGLLTGAPIVLAVMTRVPLSWLMARLGILSRVSLLIPRQFPCRRSTRLALLPLPPHF